jgi:hypothetical protein
VPVGKSAQISEFAPFGKKGLLAPRRFCAKVDSPLEAPRSHELGQVWHEVGPAVEDDDEQRAPRARPEDAKGEADRRNDHDRVGGGGQGIGRRGEALHGVGPAEHAARCVGEAEQDRHRDEAGRLGAQPRRGAGLEGGPKQELFGQAGLEAHPDECYRGGERDRPRGPRERGDHRRPAPGDVLEEHQPGRLVPRRGRRRVPSRGSPPRRERGRSGSPRARGRAVPPPPAAASPRG